MAYILNTRFNNLIYMRWKRIRKYLMLFILINLILVIMPSDPILAEETQNSEGYISPVGIYYDYSPETFQSKLYNGKPTMLDFSADRCGACRFMIPTMRALRAEYKGMVDIITVNVDTEEGLELSRKYGERYLPTFTFFDKYGKKAITLVGYQEKEDIEFVLRKLIKGEQIEEIPKEIKKSKPTYELTPIYEPKGELLKQGQGKYDGFLSSGEKFSYENFWLEFGGTGRKMERAVVVVYSMGEKIDSLSIPRNIGETFSAGKAKVTLLNISSNKIGLRVELPSSTTYKLLGDEKTSLDEPSKDGKENIQKKSEKEDLIITKTFESFIPSVGEEVVVLLKVENKLGGNVEIRIIDSIPEDFEVIFGSLDIKDTLGAGETKTYSYIIKPLKEGNYNIPEANLIYSDLGGERVITTEEIPISVSKKSEDLGSGFLSFSKILIAVGILFFILIIAVAVDRQF